MSREKDFIKNTAILSIGKMLPKITTFITLPILTAFLTKEEYGTYDLIATLVMLVIPIATLQIQSGAFRFLIECRGDHEKSSQIISNIFVVTIPVSLLASFIVQFFFSENTIPIRAAIGIYFFLDTLDLTIGQISRGLGNNKVYSAGAVIMTIVNMAGIIVFIYLGRRGLLGVLLSMISAHLITVVYRFSRIRLKSYFSKSLISGKQIRELLRYSWPMVPNNLSLWVLSLSDRLVITGFLGIAANAVYAVANKIPKLLSVCNEILVMSWQENASLAADSEDAGPYYSKLLDRTFTVMFGFTALLIGALPVLFKLLIRGSYEDAYVQIPILIVASFFSVMASYFGGIYIAHKRTANVGISTMVAAAINLIFDLAFVRVIGIWAGSLSTLVAYIFLYFYRMFDSQKFQKISINLPKQGIMILLLAVMVGFCFFRNMKAYIINVLIGVSIFFIFNRGLIQTVIRLFKKKLNFPA